MKLMPAEPLNIEDGMVLGPSYTLNKGNAMAADCPTPKFSKVELTTFVRGSLGIMVGIDYVSDTSIDACDFRYFVFAGDGPNQERKIFMASYAKTRPTVLCEVYECHSLHSMPGSVLIPPEKR